MTKKRILLLEDNASDIKLIKRKLGKSSLNFETEIATDKKSFVKVLDSFNPDVILADYEVPGFSGLEAIKLAHRHNSCLPVIIVSGVIGEDYAIETLKAGATDYVLKDKLSKLEPAIKRAIKEAHQLIEKKRVQEEINKAKGLSDSLNQINTVLASTLCFDKIMKKTVFLSRKATGVDTSCICLIENNNLVVKYLDGWLKKKVPDLEGKSFSAEQVSLADLALVTQEPVIINDTFSDKRVNQKLVRMYNSRSVIVIPLIVKKEVAGVLAFIYNNFEPRKFSAAEIDFAKKLGYSVCLAIERTRLFEAQREIAKTLQLSLLPRKIPRIRGLEIKVFYQSATDGADVGGDLYDIFKLPGGKFGLTMGDVSGKGIEAAVETAKIKYMVKDKAYLNLPPDEVMSAVNDGLYLQATTTTFTALSFAVYDPQTCLLIFSNAGNPYPYCLTDDRFIEITDVPVSIFKNMKYPLADIRLKKDDLVLFFTDGLIEARHNGSLYGEERVRAFVKRNKHLTLNGLIKGLVKEAKEFGNNSLNDDVLIIGIKKK